MTWVFVCASVSILLSRGHSLTCLSPARQNDAALLALDPNKDKADAIVSEWMGYCLLYECMLETVLVAREKWLKPTAVASPAAGVLLPNRSTLVLAGVCDPKLWASRVDFWDDVYGFNMSCFRDAPFVEPMLDHFHDATLCTETLPWHVLDHETMAVADLDFRRPFKLSVKAASEEGEGKGEGETEKEKETERLLHAMMVSFDCKFEQEDGGEEVWLRTGCADTPTHWKQTLLMIKEPVPLPAAGGCIEGFLTIERNAVNPRELDIVLEITAPVKRTQRFHMS